MYREKIILLFKESNYCTTYTNIGVKKQLWSVINEDVKLKTFQDSGLDLSKK